MKKITTILAMLMVLAVPVTAQELGDPGITPDSPFYFLDQLISPFKNPRALANERAAEVAAMAQKGHEKGLTRALAQYEKAMLKLETEAEKPEQAEEIAQQTSNHLIVLARVRANAPEQAWTGLDTAIERSARGRENAIIALEKQKPERATIIAQETLQRVIETAPEQARIQRALTAVQRRGAPEPVQIDRTMPERAQNTPAQIEQTLPEQARKIK